MIETLTTFFIEIALLAIIFAIDKQRISFFDVKDRNTAWSIRLHQELKWRIKIAVQKEIAKSFGNLEKTTRKAAIAEKFAERAFTVANAASLGVIALQKSLATPRILTKVQGQRNQLAKNDIDKLFTQEGMFDFLRPVLSDEDNDLLDKIEEQQSKENGAQ